jgi:TonB family protein
MLNRSIIVLSLAAGCLELAACQAKILPPQELQAVETATAAYHAYEQSDCATVKRLADADALDVWAFNEMRHSMKLLYAFCREIDGDLETAQAVYRKLLIEAPNSFAANDAAERIRVLKVTANDPSYALWTASAHDRMDLTKLNRTPIDRVPVQFPPLAKATGIKGYAIVEFGVTKRGGTENPVVVDSNPPLIFDGASVRAVRRWQYMRETQVDANSRQLIRLLFIPDGQTSADAGLLAPDPMSSSDEAN